MNANLYQVDAFSREPFRGNPAAVCLLSEPRPEAWMQGLATEMNLSETAFVLAEGDGWRLRWFTPTTEVGLCGHATLAGAKVLFETGMAAKDYPIRFSSRSGPLAARWVDGMIELDFPCMTPEPVEINAQVSAALGIEPVACVHSGDYYLFEAADARSVRQADPDFSALVALPTPEVMITARSDDPAFDFISRFFAPRLGINEDPVTGSAHCLLTPYWAAKLGKTELAAYQASARGGVLSVGLAGKRVRIAGEATLVFAAELLV